MWKCGFEHLDRADEVHVGVVVGPVDRHADVGLGGEVNAGVGTNALEEGAEGGAVADVSLDERGLRRDVLPPSAREVVDHVNLVSPRDEGVGDVRADEACPAGDDDAHIRIVGARVG